MTSPAETSADEIELGAAAARAWPARERAALGPWLARWNGGYTRRANSVALLGQAEAGELADLIVQAEAFYRQREVPCRFQVSDVARNAALVAALGERGYSQEPASRTHVQVAATRGLRLIAPPTREGRVRIADGPTIEWIDRWFAEQGPELDTEGRDTLTELLWEIPGRRAFASHIVDGQVAATGLGVADGTYLGLFCAVTDPAVRHRGSARRVLGGLATWGMALATRTAYLQVAADNEAALRLTAAAGFTPVYDYHYYLAGR